MSSLISLPSPVSAIPAGVDHDPVGAVVSGLSTKGLEMDIARARMNAIHADLVAGDIDQAYATFTDWIRQEARYAGAHRHANVRELVTAMLEMLGWMFDRVPRSMVKSAVQAA